MTDEEQRIAIAEFFRWKKFRCERHDGVRILVGELDGERMEVPDYLNDLNAMHAAEKFLPNYEVSNYVKELRVVCGGASLIFASSAGRAEAFVRAIGKWEKSK